jgi:putative DNA primase/helicase
VTAKEAIAIIKQMRREQYRQGNSSGQTPPPKTSEATSKREAILVRADTLDPESISWAWPNRFAFGKMAMIAGDPGLGKSTILIEIAALHSKGGDFPCGEGKAVLCETLYLTAEDGLRDTLVPRLMAAEADLSKIHFLTGTKVEGAAADDVAMFDITSDIILLRKVFTENPNIKILIIDPLTAYLGASTKAKENTDVRRVLGPLVRLVEEFGILLLANNHLNKNSGKALYRILDSIAFVALGRTVHLVAMDADNQENRKFICDKSNIGSKPLGLTYFIQKYWINGPHGEPIETSRISWGFSHIDETADEALGATNDDAPTMAEEAEKFLREILAKGRVAIPDIEAEARAAGLLGQNKEIRNAKPFRKACDSLGVVHSREGFGPGAVYFWSLPAADIHARPMRASSKARAHMEGEGAHGENKGNNGVEEEAEGAHARNIIAHARPQTTCAPSGYEGAHEGAHGEEGAHEGNSGKKATSPSADHLGIPPFLQRTPTNGSSAGFPQGLTCHWCGDGISPGAEITIRSTAPGQPLAAVHPGCLDEWQQQ